MSYKILTKNGIDNSNIDGARGEYFNSGMRDGIVQGALNEGLFTATASNIISLDTCELRIAGHRIVIDEPVYHAFSNAPSTDTRYAFVAQIVVDENQNVDFSLFVQTASTPLIQNDLYKNITGVGTYQVEIGRFTLLTSLTIEDVVRTIDVITGGGDKGEQGEQGADGKDALTTSYVFSETTDPNPQDIMLIDDDEFNRTPENDEDLIVLWNNTTTGDTFICNCKTIVGISASGTNVKILNYYKLNASGGGGGSDGNNPIASFTYLTPNISNVYYNESYGIDITGEGYYSDNLGGHTINSTGMTLPIIAGEGISITPDENNHIVISSTGSGGSGGTVAELVPNGTDINTYRGENYWGRTFYAGGQNTVQNLPYSNGAGFSLEILRAGTYSTVQRLSAIISLGNEHPTVYTRSVTDTATAANGTWSEWQEVAEAQGEYPSMGAGKFIGTRVAENTDLNSLIPSSSKTALHYYCDSIAAAQTFENCPVDAPFNMITFAPQTSGGRYSQILFAISMPEMIFSRYCNDNSWSAWRQYATTDGTYPDMTVGKAQSDENGNGLMSHATRNKLLNGTTSYDFNDYVEWGNYELHGTPDDPLVNAPTSTSNPSSSNADWYLSVFKRDSVYVTQVVYSVRSDAAMAIRVLSNGNWGEWKTIGEGGGSGDYDLLYSMFSEDESINFGYTSGLMAGDSIALNTKPYNRLKIYAWLNTIPAQIDVKINDTIKNEFVLSATPSTFTGFYFLKVQLTTVKTRFLVLKYSTFTYNTTDGTFDFVQGTAHPNFYIYRIEGYEKINA